MYEKDIEIFSVVFMSDLLRLMSGIHRPTIMALLRKETYNLRHLMHLCHPTRYICPGLYTNSDLLRLWIPLIITPLSAKEPSSHQ